MKLGNRHPPTASTERPQHAKLQNQTFFNPHTKIQQQKLLQEERVFPLGIGVHILL